MHVKWPCKRWWFIRSKKIKKLSKTQLAGISKLSYEKLAFEITKLLLVQMKLIKAITKKFVKNLQ